MFTRSLVYSFRLSAFTFFSFCFFLFVFFGLGLAQMFRDVVVGSVAFVLIVVAANQLPAVSCLLLL